LFYEVLIDRRFYVVHPRHIDKIPILIFLYWLHTFYRLSTIQAADRIVVMDGGQVVEVIFLSIYFEPLDNLSIISFLEVCYPEYELHNFSS
jgi:hypothetical protein